MAGEPIRLIFRIDAYQPNTIPMVRLAEYMVEIAVMIGERASVHFVELKPGSVQLVHDVEYEAYPKVEARALALRNGAAPADAMKAYWTVNKSWQRTTRLALILCRTAGIIFFIFLALVHRSQFLSHLLNSQRRSMARSFA